MRFPFRILTAALWSLLVFAGCGGSRYAYRIVTDDCNCEEYTVRERQHGIEYRFRASYKMDQGIVTTVRIRFRNDSRDTLFLDPGMVKIASRNVDYRYNNKFVPLPQLIVPPSSSEEVTMTGADVSQADDWNKIAGEQLTITLKGILLGKVEIPSRTVAFVPENPKLHVP